jgi:hypothetical protein
VIGGGGITAGCDENGKEGKWGMVNRRKKTVVAALREGRGESPSEIPAAVSRSRTSFV